MTIEIKSSIEYIRQLPADRQESISRLREVINQNLPEGFAEVIIYGMIGWVVPHEIYPAGYHCNPKDPLPFLNIASQKNYISVYHSGIYADETLMKWFLNEYAEISPKKPDMGKSCIRFKKPEQIPFELIGELAKKMSVQEWIRMYEERVKR
jgi:uncharacterized protein YdhG (YjbR/CyaY superfamily)